jgi:hypothetical protein
MSIAWEETTGVAFSFDNTDSYSPQPAGSPSRLTNSNNSSPQHSPFQTMKNSEMQRYAPPDQITGYSQPIKVPNHLVDQQKFLTVGRTDSIEIEPAMVTFAGFEISPDGEEPRVETQTFRILNISATRQRVLIHQPESGFFSCAYEKKGLIAPGMFEEVTVQFVAREYITYKDRIRIQTPSGNLVVPIQAFPIMNPEIFPTKINLPTCELGHTVSKTITLINKVPLEFEFEFSVVKPQDDFSISPASGRVPPRGKVDVVVIIIIDIFLISRKQKS